MPSEQIAAFAAELKSIHESKPPLSKSKIQDITKAALKAKAEYKHVVHSIEKFLPRCRTEHKLSIVYIIDSIIRMARHQLKEKDVFARRFHGVFTRILPKLLECAPMEQLRVVRTVNLWIAAGIYTEEDMKEFKDVCAASGIQTDAAEVERLVKGKKADMKIYKDKDRRRSGSSKNEQPQFEATTPPGPPPQMNLSGHQPPQHEQKNQLPFDDLSDEIPPSGISEKTFLRLLMAHDCDFGNSFSTDRNLLKRAHLLMIGRLQTIEQEKRTAHGQNLKKLLKYDYSDDEEEDGEKKKEEEEDYVPISVEERERICVNLLGDVIVRDAFKMMHIERIDKLNQIAREAQMKNLVGSGLLPTPQAPLGPPPGMGMPPPSSMSGLPPGGAGLALPPGNFSLPPPHLPQGLPNFALPPGIPPSGPVANNLMNFLPPGALMNFGQIAGIPPNFPLAPNQPGMLPLLGNGLNPAMLPLGVPPPNMGNPPPPFPMMPQQQQGVIPLPPDEDLRQDADRGRKRRSRSRERIGDDRKKSRRSPTSREKRTSETEEQKKKRKMGFPAEPFPENISVVTRTLWFGRLPSNCTEKDIQETVKPWGATTNIKLISARACAYVTMENRKSAYDIIKSKQQKPIKIREREIKIDYSLPPSILNEEDKQTWDQEKGFLYVAWRRLPPSTMLSGYFDGAQLDTSTLPPALQSSIDEFGRPIEPGQAAEGDMELSSPIGHDMEPAVPAFNTFTNVLGLQPPPGLPPQMLQNSALLPLPMNPVALGQPMHEFLGMGGMPRGLPQGLPPGLHGGPPMGLLPTTLSQPPPFGGMPIPSLGSAPPPQRGPLPHLHGFDGFDANRDPLGGGGFRGGFRGTPRGGRGGFRGGQDRGGFHGDRSGFRNNFNDRPPMRDDFRGGDRRPDFRRDGGPPRRDFGSRDFQRRSPDRRGDDHRRDNGRRRESRWGGNDDRDDSFQKPPQEESNSYERNGAEPLPPGVDLNSDAPFQPLPPSDPTVTSTTKEPDHSHSSQTIPNDNPAPSGDN